MYETAGIAPLSQTQVSKLLNHHSVRVKAGIHHKVGLSKAQMKKHSKAQMKGTGYNLTLDPYQVTNMQYLRDEVGKAMRVKKAARGGKLLIDQPFTVRQAADTVGQLFKSVRGGKLLIDQPFTARQAVNTVGNFVNDPKGTIGFGFEGPLPSPDRRPPMPYQKARGMDGGKINRLNKFNRWTGALGGVAQNIGDFIAPVAKPIFQAGTQRAVNYINGMGVKKSRGRPKKGGNLKPAGAPPLIMGRGKKKKAMHFAV